MENITPNSAPETEVKNKNSNNLISIVVVLCILAIGAFLLVKTDPKPKVKNIKNADEASVEDLSAKVLPPDPNEHVLGNLATAKVVIVEYSDTECPFCKRFHETMHTIMADTKGQVAWVYRHFPIPQLHSKAPHEALATECAWEQGGNETFWKYTDEVYKQTNSNDSLPTSALTSIASNLKLDMAKFQTCLDNETYKDKVDSQILSGQSIGIQGTPTSLIFVNGLVVDTIKGALPYANVMSQIESYLE